MERQKKLTRYFVSNKHLRGYHVPGANTPTHIVETPVSSSRKLFFQEALLGELGRLPCLDLATEPSPPRSADGLSAAAVLPIEDSPQRDLEKAPLIAL